MPNVNGAGNSKPDVQWLDEQSEKGLLFSVEEEDRPADCLFQYNYQWDLYASELDMDWYLPWYRSKPDRRCNGTAYIRDETGMYIGDVDWQRLTRPCLAPPMAGAPVCHAHGAKIPVVVAAAQRRLAEASDLVAERLIGLTGTRDEEGFKVRSVDRIAAAAHVLDRAGVKGGVEVDVKATGFQNVLADLFGVEASDGADA